MEEFSINLDQTHPQPILELKGYFTHEAGIELQKQIQELLRAKKEQFIIDFGNCPVINSPGVALLLDVIMQVNEDFKGVVFLTRLDALKAKVFRMAGILLYSQNAPTIEDALKAFSELE